MFYRVSDGLKVHSTESKDLNDPKELDDLQKFDDQKGISIVSKDFENPKFYDDYLHLRWSCFHCFTTTEGC